MGLLRVQYRDLGDLSEHELLLHDVEARFGGGLGLDGRLHRAGIGLQAAKSVGDILHRRDHGLAVVRKFFEVTGPNEDSA
jgi:hypothetical protein